MIYVLIIKTLFLLRHHQ